MCELACRLFHKTIFEYNGKSIQCIPLFLRFVLRLAFFSVAFSRNLLFTLAPRLRALHCFYPLSPVSCRNSPFFLLFNIVLSYMYIHTYMLAWARVSFICRWWLGWRWFSWPYFRFVVVHSRFYGFSRPSPYNLPPTFGEMGESSSRIICKNHGNNR